MTRVSTFGNNQLLLQGILQNQAKLFDAQQQVNTGKKTTEFRGLGGKATALLGARSVRLRTESYQDIILQVKGRIDANDNQLEAALSNARDFRQSVLEVIAQEDSVIFEEQLENAYTFIANAFNTTVAGLHIFAGSKTDVPPVSTNSVADFAALANSDDVFQNDDIGASARVADNIEIEFGIQADEASSEVFAALHRIANFHFGPSGPINGPLDATQRAFLETELANLEQAIDVTQRAQAENAVRLNQLEDLELQHRERADFLTGFISDIEDVDLAEAITRVNNDQTALQVSYSVVGRLADLTLLNFL